MHMKEMIKKEIDNLPDSLAAEVYDFIMFLESKKGKINLVRSAQLLSTTTFQKIWDNEEDAVYDSL